MAIFGVLGSSTMVLGNDTTPISWQPCGILWLLPSQTKLAPEDLNQQSRPDKIPSSQTRLNSWGNVEK